MPDKYEWRKREKQLYIPRQKPEIVEVPAFNFLTIGGAGSPDDKAFTDKIATLYPLAYGIKMQPKKMAVPPQGYFDFTVYPLEGIWDINDEAKKHFTGTINKEDLVYQLMIRQPDFVAKNFYEEILELVKNKKPNPLLDEVKFERLSEGKCVQMLHVGKFEDEAETFAEMEAFAEQQGLTRLSKLHREIYLSDFRKVAPEKMKTVLRFKVR